MNSFNYSAINTARRCNKLFQYIYLDKLQTDVAPSGDLAFGTAIHLGVESLLGGDDGIELFKTYWGLQKDNDFGRFDWDALLKQGEILLTKFQKYHLKKFEVFQMEQRLYGTFGDGIGAEGTPDVIGKYNGVESVIDFKTTGSPYHKDKIKTAEQLYLYAFLAKQALRYDVKQLVYFPFVKGPTPSIQTAQIIPFKQEVCNTIISDLQEECKQLLFKQENKVFTRNRSNCIIGNRRCDYWKLCYETEGT